ncbi:sugar ABC transporter ATP-binding protein [Nocardioides sp.]|uniref:sugar ABC transporter ATP-binding protein n=1 Tax=Nocardioides sp. TaxID=35761 RepID=UPI003D0EC9E9
MHDVALTLRNLGKTYAGQVALSGVSFEVRAGEVHALVGENGCGKSTLIKSLSGYHTSDAGSEIWVGGERLPDGHGSRQARDVGLAFVHQDLGLIPSLTVVENLALGRGFLAGRPWRINWAAECRRASSLLSELGIDVDPRTRLGDLSQADRTLVAIARGLNDAGSGGRVLVLDEPTAALPDAEVERLFAFVRRLQARGLGIIYVSHRFDEIFELAQRVTVLRDGRHVGTYDVADLDERSLVTTMIGRPMDELVPQPARRVTSETVLRADGLCGSRVAQISFDLRRGEVLGIAGLLGSGRSELGRLIAGTQVRTGGSLEIEGRQVTWRRPLDAIRAGVVLVPEDRRRDGGILSMGVAANITLPDVWSFFRRGRFRHGQERLEAERLSELYDIRPRDSAKLFAQLSGGNQQKVVLAKWMRLRPRVIVFDEPVQGVDVGAKGQIYAEVDRAAADGAGVLLIDSDFEDLARVCSRVLVLRSGRICAELTGSDLTRDRIAEYVYLTDQEAGVA